MPTLISKAAMSITKYGRFLCATSRLYGLNHRNSSSKHNSKIAETSVLLQRGVKLYELPLLVRKTSELSIKQLDNQTLKREKFNPYKISEKERAIVSSVNRCHDSFGVFHLLDFVPREEMTPYLACHAIKKVLQLENNFELRNEGFRESIRGSLQQHTFLRWVSMSFLMHIVCNCKEPTIILETIGCMKTNRFPGEQMLYKARLLEELHLCVMDGLLSVQEVCKAINLLSTFYPDHKQCMAVTDQLWVGILDKPMTSRDMVAVFMVLPHLTTSRDIIMQLLEAKAIKHSSELSPMNIVQIVGVLPDLKDVQVSKTFLRMVLRLLMENINNMSEKEMLAVVSSFNQMEYLDAGLVTIMEKMLQRNFHRLGKADLISAICSYCVAKRIRSPTILEGAAEYFINHQKIFSVLQVSAIAGLFGQMNCPPHKSLQFWNLVEKVLEDKFIQFAPMEIINLLVSFAYIEQFSLKLVSKLFDQYFLERLHSQTEDLVYKSRQQLKLLDITLSMECREYGGPFLSADMNNRMATQDTKVSGTVTKLMDSMSDLLDNKTMLERDVLPSSLPNHPFYTVDILISPGQGRPVAVLVLSPEQYDSTGVYMLGMQGMLVRQLKENQYRVVCVNMDLVDGMNPAQLKEYTLKLCSQY